MANRSIVEKGHSFLRLPYIIEPTKSNLIFEREIGWNIKYQFKDWNIILVIFRLF